MANLISKYNIPEKDIYEISFMISSYMEKKGHVGFIEKEKLRRKVLTMLKPFKVSPIDLPKLINEIHLSKCHTDPNLIQVYGPLNLDSFNYHSWQTILAKPIFIGSGIGFALVCIVFFISSLDKKECGCRIPDVTIPNYADSWEDKAENWEYKDCDTAKSEEFTENINVYVFYNFKVNKYRCQLRYSWPGNDCNGFSKTFGENAISTADISQEDYKSGQWKSFDYWAARHMYPR
jgi:hypothetical protein